MGIINDFADNVKGALGMGNRSIENRVRVGVANVVVNRDTEGLKKLYKLGGHALGDAGYLADQDKKCKEERDRELERADLAREAGDSEYEETKRLKAGNIERRMKSYAAGAIEMSDEAGKIGLSLRAAVDQHEELCAKSDAIESDALVTRFMKERNKMRLNYVDTEQKMNRLMNEGKRDLYAEKGLSYVLDEFGVGGPSVKDNYYDRQLSLREARSGGKTLKEEKAEKEEEK